MSSESTQETRMRDQVFISFSHKEAEWMEKFSAQLKVIQQTNRLEIWSDKRIESGQNWREEIDAGLKQRHCTSLLRRLENQ